MLYDTHAHYDSEEYAEDRDELLEKVHQEGVDLINNIGADMESSKNSIKLAENHDFVYATVGVHPSEVGGMTEKDIEELREMAKHEKVVAIGEIGLDYHYMDGTSEEDQRFWFKRQLELAKELDMPVVIHDRESKGQCIEILKEMDIHKGVMHCFSGSAETAKILLDMGFFISFTGVVTFKNARKAVEAVKAIPIERLFIETDAPYMAPEPVRGTRNHSGNVIRVAEKFAEIKGMDVEEVKRITTENAMKFFGIK